MPRRRIGDGPSPCVLGDILLALARRGEAAMADGQQPGMTATELAGELKPVMNSISRE